MCLSPIPIPNPNYHSPVKFIQDTRDTENTYIYVPCGVCSECLFLRQSDIVQRARVLSLDHYIFFCTLTYNFESLRKVTTSTGFEISYVDATDIQKMHKRIRYRNLFGREYLYFFVSERGGKKGRPHVHGLIFIPKFPDDDKLFPATLEQRVRHVLFTEWKRNYGSDRKPDWRPLFTYHQVFKNGKLYKNFDCHYVVSHSTEHGADDVSFYCTKYLLKPSNKENALQQALKLNLPPDEYYDIWKLVRSRSFVSRGFGFRSLDEADYIADCIERSKDHPDGFKFYNSDGSTFPLARYYRKCIDGPSALRSIAARGGPLVYREREFDDKLSALNRGRVVRSKVSERDIINFIDDD